MKRLLFDRKRFTFNKRSFPKRLSARSKRLFTAKRFPSRLWARLLPLASISFVLGFILSTVLLVLQYERQREAITAHTSTAEASLIQPSPQTSSQPQPILLPPLENGRPQLYPLPVTDEEWQCEVVVVGGSLGGVAAAAHAMQSGAITCLIELTPWLGGQISAQGVSAIDESRLMWDSGTFSQSWTKFKTIIEQQTVKLPSWVPLTVEPRVENLNSCWVGRLCFSPQAGATAAQQLLKASSTNAPGSKWGTSIAFKGAEFDATGKLITTIHAVRRTPIQANYVPEGWFSRELGRWYSWQDDEVFSKQALRLHPFPGKQLLVIDATDTGELVGWAGIPHHLGTEAKTTTGEPNAPINANPDCLQAFTYPFVLALHNDRGASLKVLADLKPDYSRQEHQREFSLKRYPMFEGAHNFFNYRRIVSMTRNNPFYDTSLLGDMTVVNWNRGNDWTWMNPPLLLNEPQIDATGQRQNWKGGLATIALRSAQEHALLFAEWLMKHKSTSKFPLMLMTGAQSPLGTTSGLSMVPYIREGRRIVGRSAYGQRDFMIREQDLRKDLSGGRDFNRTAIAVTHYAIDLHGCRYRNWQASDEATSAPVREANVRPLQIPLESLIPQGVDNLLIGGKSLAVTHIADAVTRTHYSEWSIGAAAGATAGWLSTQAPPNLSPAAIPKRFMPELQRYLTEQGLRWYW
ncbi:MAG: FAD-dependent oxidoreductase [Leptolyngbya sp. BL-A-14]